MHLAGEIGVLLKETGGEVHHAWCRQCWFKIKSRCGLSDPEASEAVEFDVRLRTEKAGARLPP